AGELHTARREIEHLRAAGVELTVNLVLVTFRLVFETAVCLGEQVVARSVNDCMARADLDARGDAAFRDAMRAQLTLHDLRERLVPLELRHAIRACDLAVATADALGAVPRDDTMLALLERADHARRHAAGIDAVHALHLHERRVLTVVVVLDDVLRIAGERVGRIPAALRIFRLEAVRLAACDHARLASDAQCGVVEQADGIGRRLLRLARTRGRGRRCDCGTRGRQRLERGTTGQRHAHLPESGGDSAKSDGGAGRSHHRSGASGSARRCTGLPSRVSAAATVLSASGTLARTASLRPSCVFTASGTTPTSTTSRGAVPCSSSSLSVAARPGSCGLSRSFGGWLSSTGLP